MASLYHVERVDKGLFLIPNRHHVVRNVKGEALIVRGLSTERSCVVNICMDRRLHKNQDYQLVEVFKKEE